MFFLNLSQELCICSGLKYRFFLMLKEIGKVSFALSLGIHNDKNIHLDRSFFFRAHGTLKRIFTLKTQHRIVYDHHTFCMHRMGEKVKLCKAVKKVSSNF